jgi:hypothetical protein
VERGAVAILAALALLFVGAVAHADMTVQARGSAPVTGGDAAGARARALDDALRQAVDQAVAATVEPAARAAGADAIKKRILRRARAYVPQFKVAEEGVTDNVYAVQIEATVADGQLASDLRALGVGAPAPPAGPGPAAPAPEPQQPPPAARPALALLVVTGAGARTWSSFGKAGDDGGPVAAALARELGARGFKVARTAGLEVPVTLEAAARPPLDARQAAALTRAAGAGGALVGTARFQDGGRIRGTRDVGAELDLDLELDDVGTGRVGSANVQAAGYGVDAAAAEVAAARAAAIRAGRALAPRLEAHWPEEGSGSAHGVLVRVRGAGRSADVDAIARALAGVPGVQAVAPARFARREVTLLVRGGAAARALAEAAGQVVVPDLQVAARAAGAEVSVDLAGDSGRPPPIQPQ